MRMFLLCAAVLLLAGAFAEAAADKDLAFSIRMHRESRPGDKFRLAVKASMQMVSEHRVGELVEKDNEAFDTDFSGRITVLEITKGGGKKKVAIVIENFLITEDKFRFVALPKGTRLIASLKNREVMIAEALEGRDDGKPMAAGIELDALRQVISLDNEGDVTDDDIFGSKKKQRVGDKWPVNKAKAIEDFRKDRIRIKAIGFKGETGLTGVVKVRGIECYSLKGSFDAKGFRPPIPQGFRVKASGLTARYSGSFPVDTKLPELETTVEVRMHFLANLRNIGMSMDRRVKKEIQVTPLD